MDRVPEIKEIDTAMLTGFVRQALGSPTAEIDEWEHEPVRYINTEEVNLGLHRFRGSAQDRGRAFPWSLILKAVRAPIHETEPTFWNYHRREILAYQSGLLEDLEGALTAPRCLGMTEHREGLCWLWLEDVTDSTGPAWSLEEYALAAGDLGRFNGVYAAGHPLPVFPWLSRHWVQGWLAHYDVGCRATLQRISDEGFWEHPLLKPNFPRPIRELVLRMWEGHASLLSTLNQLPQTFCHMDAYRPNLFLRRTQQGTRQTVAVDWVFAGIGALGEEIANLWAASLIWLEYEASDAKRLDQVIFASYLEGLRSAGWQGDARLVRLGYTAACALRWGVVGLWWLRSIGDPGEERDFEKHWGRPMPELVLQWATTAYHVLDMAEEAFELQRQLM